MADCMEKDWSFTGSDGVHTLYATIWEPSEGEPRAVIQICHGMMEHIRRYDRFARALCDRGFVVCGDDHLGHGRTAEQPEDLGYFGETDGWKHMAEDELLLRREMQRRYPDKPYFLLGHSMGSFITRRVIALDGEGLAGYICCGTAGRNPLTKLGIGLAGIVTALRGPKRTGRFLNAMAFQNYNRRFPEDDNELAWLSRDKDGYPTRRRITSVISCLPTRASGISSACSTASPAPSGATGCPRICPSSCFPERWIRWAATARARGRCTAG